MDLTQVKSGRAELNISDVEIFDFLRSNKRKPPCTLHTLNKRKVKKLKTYIYKGQFEIQEIKGEEDIFVKDHEYTLDENNRQVKKMVELELLKQASKASKEQKQSASRPAPAIAGAGAPQEPAQAGDAGAELNISNPKKGGK